MNSLGQVNMNQLETLFTNEKTMQIELEGGGVGGGGGEAHVVAAM